MQEHCVQKEEILTYEEIENMSPLLYEIALYEISPISTALSEIISLLLAKYGLLDISFAKHEITVIVCQTMNSFLINLFQEMNLMK